MKKETLITAIVFLGVGFLAGFAFSAHRNSVQRQKAATSSALAAPAAQPGQADAPAASDTAASPNGSTGSGGTPGAIGSQLPKGHPPVNDAEVIQFFKDASARSPKDPAPRLKLADFLYDRRRFTEAIPWYQQALALDPKNVDARTDMATCLFNLGRASEAVDQLHEALKIDPRHEPTLFNLIVVNLDGTHNFKAADEAMNQLRVINPGYPGLGQLEQTLGMAGTGLSGQPDPTGQPGRSGRSGRSGKAAIP
ncbi:MAG: tetratricopeptide repeat protein [Terriglobia bacterium]